MKTVATFLIALLVVSPLVAAETREAKTQTVTGTINVGNFGLEQRSQGALKDHQYATLAQPATGGEYVNLTWSSENPLSDLDVYFVDSSGAIMEFYDCASFNFVGFPEDETLEVYSNDAEERCKAPAGAKRVLIAGGSGYMIDFTFTYDYVKITP